MQKKMKRLQLVGNNFLRMLFRVIKQFDVSFRHHHRSAANKDISVGLNAGGNYGGASHCFALEEGTFGFVSETAALLEIVGQRGIGGAGSRLLRNVVERRKIAHMGGIVIIAEGENMETNRLVFLCDG